MGGGGGVEDGDGGGVRLREYCLKIRVRFWNAQDTRMFNGNELRFQQALRMTISDSNHLEGWQSRQRCAALHSTQWQGTQPAGFAWARPGVYTQTR
jgi:hypothetical protein